MDHDREGLPAPKHKPEWVYDTPINFWELSLPEQLIYSSAYGADFQFSHNKRGSIGMVANNALYSFWRIHGNPRYSFPSNTSFRFTNDDWGH